MIKFKGPCISTDYSAQAEEDEQDEEEQEILALPAPGDDNQEGQVEAEMHAAIASAELADYAKVIHHAIISRSTYEYWTPCSHNRLGHAFVHNSIILNFSVLILMLVQMYGGMHLCCSPASLCC